MIRSLKPIHFDKCGIRKPQSYRTTEENMKWPLKDYDKYKNIKIGNGGLRVR